LIKTAVLYYDKKEVGINYTEYMEAEWYRSLNPFDPDYSIYNDEYYFTDMWVCWQMYSRGYLRSINHPHSEQKDHSIGELFSHVSTVVDLGCGIGYTTAALTELFPMENVFATNLEGTRQWKWCNEMSKVFGFTLLPDTTDVNQKDCLVVAFEYFEHFYKPIEHLKKVLQDCDPEFLYLANSFNTRSMGHFTEYEVDGQVINQKHINREFNAALKREGYRQVKTNVWNNKPALWFRNES
jgi:SAM-dependent methyltransferase